jgi:putative ABC transport system permease protein
MLRATIRSLLARKLRLILSGLAVVLGVTFVAGSLVLTDTIGNAFDNLFAGDNAKNAVVVRGDKTAVSDTRVPVPASVLPLVRRVDGVAAANGVVQGYAQLVDKKNKTYPYHGQAPTFGFNFEASQDLDNLRFVNGHGPRGPDEIAIDKATADGIGYHVGDTAKVLTRLAPKRYRIVGIFVAGGSVNQGGATLTVFTQSTAQHIFGRPGEFDEIDIASKPGVSQKELRDRVAPVLPDGVQAVTGVKAAKDTAADVKQFLSFFTTFLLVFAGVALFVGAFIIFNTFTMLIGQRLRELALYRSLGASRGQVIRSVVVESVVVGFIASTIGLGLGTLVAYGLRALLRHISGGSTGGSLVFAGHTVIAAYAVGIIITVLAALIPAWRAARVPPIAALRDATLPESSMRRSIIVGTILLVIGGLSLAKGLTGTLPLLGLGAVCIFLGVVALSPLVVPFVVRVLSAPFRRRVPGRLGRRNAVRNPRRTSTTAGALMIGLSLIGAISVLGASVQTSVRGIINRAFAGDFVVEPRAFDGGVTPALGQSLAGNPAIKQADPLGFGPALVDKIKVDQVTAMPARAMGVTVEVQTVSGTDQLGANTILVDKSVAKDHHWHVGERLPVRFERGPTHPLTVGGIYTDNQLAGSYLVSDSQRRYFEQRLDGVLLIKGADGVSSHDVRATLLKAVRPYPNVKVRTHDQFIDETVGNISFILTFITLLLLFSVAIAVLGIVNTLALSIIERTRELGLLRAVGLSRRQMRRMVRVESVVVSVFGGVLGLVVGTALGIAMTQALHSQGFTALTIPYGRMIEFLVFSALVGIVAAIFPAWRASRLDVLQAIATE